VAALPRIPQASHGGGSDGSFIHYDFSQLISNEN
jgi:hypothetical protein